MSSATFQKVRLYVITASVTAVTATGAWYGAGLKMRQEYKQEKKAVVEITTAQKIEQIEMTKSKLLEQRTEMQQKIDRLTAKMQAKSEESQQQQTG